MKFELILAVDSGDGQITNVPLAHMTRPDVSELGVGARPVGKQTAVDAASA